MRLLIPTLLGIFVFSVNCFVGLNKFAWHRPVFGSKFGKAEFEFKVDKDKLIVEKLPEVFEKRYGTIPKSILIRECYLDLYNISLDLMTKHDSTSVVFTGVPGIGKSLFLIYFVFRMISTGAKYFACELFLDGCFLFKRDSSKAGVYMMSVVDDLHLPMDAVVLVDLAEPREPYATSKHTFVFSSPNPNRFKELLKRHGAYKFILPTWSETELLAVNGNRSSWIQRYEAFGGVARQVLWSGRGANPLISLNEALQEKGAAMAEYFFTYGHGGVDDDLSYSLCHIEPDTLNGTVLYDQRRYAIASQYVLDKLTDLQTTGMKNAASSAFSICRLAKEKFGPSTAGDVFEYLLFRLLPITGQALTPLIPLSKTPLRPLPPVRVPLNQIILEGELSKVKNCTSNVLYYPRSKRSPAADAFFAQEVGGGKHILVALQSTVGESHEINAPGWKKIVAAFSGLSFIRKVFIFVTPPQCSIDKLQTVKKGKAKFEQYKYEHMFTKV